MRILRPAPELLLLVLAGAGLIHALVWHAGPDWLATAFSWVIIAILAGGLWYRRPG
jgi:hypothetical protein